MIGAATAAIQFQPCRHRSGAPTHRSAGLRIAPTRRCRHNPRRAAGRSADGRGFVHQDRQGRCSTRVTSCA
ncbi:hypothetical protein [Lysobacter gummosus]|uniref:hypothetical protein n=1 Tax=Lysobacter gummosus TaxID=262324 RepID=UPI0036256741